MIVSASPRRMRTAFCTPRTPAWERASVISGSDAWRSSSSRRSVIKRTVPASPRDASPNTDTRSRSAQEPRESPVLQRLPARLAGRAVVDRVLLVVHTRDGRAADRTGLAELVVDAVHDLVALSLLSQLECPRQVLAHRARQPLELRRREVGRELEGRELRSVEDLVRMRAPDAREDALVAEKWMELPSLAAEDCRERGRRARERVRPEGREVGLGLLRSAQPYAGPLLLPGLREDE